VAGTSIPAGYAAFLNPACTPLSTVTHGRPPSPATHHLAAGHQGALCGANGASPSVRSYLPSKKVGKHRMINLALVTQDCLESEEWE
ncbi:hypothetical protein, partial [Arhodomonas sp. AD133]|uniref:hypothetical protein n=1 Tax=Arhodomonas sp. AD133 TaxID=3415009 RepID=UPI003EB86AB1